MSFVTDLLTSSVGTIVDSIGDAIDKNITNDEERLTLKNELIKMKLEAQASRDKLEAEFEKEISKRWVSDNEHVITRLVRPVSYAVVLTVFLSLVFTDGNVGEFVVKESYTGILETLMSVMTVAYFGGRSYEKGKRL